MQHLIFLYYIVSLTLGITGITVTILLYVKYRLKIIKYYLVLLLLFTIYLLLLNIHYYQRTIVFLDSDLVRYTASIPGLSYADPVKPMNEMLKLRHLSPIYGGRVSIAPEKKDHFRNSCNFIFIGNYKYPKIKQPDS